MTMPQLTGALLVVLACDCLGYVLAVNQLAAIDPVLTVALEDIFVVVALLTITVGLIIPGMIAHAASSIALSAEQLSQGTLTDFVRAMEALGRGDLEAAHARVTVMPVIVHSRDELGSMAASFNTMQQRIAQAAHALEGASQGLQTARDELTTSHSALRVSEERFRALSEYGTDLVLIADIAGTVRYASPSLARVLGIEPASMIGARLYTSVHPDDVENVRAALEPSAWLPDEVRRLDLRIIHANGNWRTVEFIATNRLGDPAVLGIILSGRDVTDRVRDQRAADKARIAAEEVAYLRSDFVASVSHELRTPLTSIVGYGELLVHRWGCDLEL
jgi:PAS domain S-box-containing protein